MRTKSTRGIGRKKKELPDIALRSPTSNESLPLPFVHYPNHYGTFLSFSETEHSQQYFCSCCEVAIENYLILREYIDKARKVKSSWGFHHDFSDHYVTLTKTSIDYDQVFLFRDKLCHRCNLSTPSLRWCHEMYGSKFKQYYGWYVSQMKYRLGFMDTKFIQERCAPEVAIQLTSIKNIDIHSLTDNNVDYQQYFATLKSLDVLVENSTRQEFGFRNIGDGWVNESVLYNIVHNLYPEEMIFRRFRPDWLNGLELDIFLPNLKIAFEYQGQQHYFPIKAWGGKSSFEQLQERDRRKKTICSALNITLIEIAYTEPLNEVHILQKINDILHLKKIDPS